MLIHSVVVGQRKIEGFEGIYCNSIKQMRHLSVQVMNGEGHQVVLV